MKLKILLWIPIVIALVFSLTGIGFSFENEPKGVRGLNWGDPLTPEMKFLYKQDEWWSVYRKVDEKLSLGDAKFHLILYVFYTPSSANVAQFMTSAFYYKRKENFEILKTICMRKFGEPTNERYCTLEWTSLSSTVILSYDNIEEEGYLGIGSTPLFQQYTEEKEKKQVEEAEEDW